MHIGGIGTMRGIRWVRRVVGLTIACGLAACAGAGGAASANATPVPVNPAQRVVASASGNTITYAQLAERVAPGAVVILASSTTTMSRTVPSWRC